MKTFYVPVFLTRAAVVEVKADSWDDAIDSVDQMDSKEVNNQALRKGEVYCEVDVDAIDDGFTG
jgi:hypothetical protein